MKEAAGEANVTVITIVLIGLVAAAGAVLIPRIITNIKVKSCCTEYGGTWQNGKCTGSSLGNADQSFSASDIKTNYKSTCGLD